MKGITKLMRAQLTLLRPILDSCSLTTSRKGQDRVGKLMARAHKDEITTEDFPLGHLECAMISPKDEVSNGVILYLHGGGFTAGSLNYAKGFGSVLAAKCGIRVMCVAYRLAPEHIFPAALDDALEAYLHLLSVGYGPEKILLCGESAGGGLCYSLCLRLKEKGWTQPAGIIAISPWTDLTASGDSYTQNEKLDPHMTKARLKFFSDCYLYGDKSGGTDSPISPRDDQQNKAQPLVSPLFGELEKLPPSLIFAGGDEIMLDDARLMHEKLLSSGCKSKLEIAPGMWHGYVLYDLKEFSGDFQKIRRFIRSTVPDQKKLRWMALDNAAKIFPASKNRNWSNVFRLSATLKEPVDTEILQSALEVTVRRFPSIAVRMRAGFFWYYLEELPKAPKIMDEQPYPLSRMIQGDIRKCAFRVIVYDNRIAAEFFHALTDGNGGLVFLKTLVAEYILQKYGVSIPCINGILDRLEEPSEAELEDSFLRYAGEYAASRKATDAYRIQGNRELDGFCTNTTFILDADAVVAEAKKRNITVTTYMASALLLAAQAVQAQNVHHRKHYKPVKLVVPVNLRKLFPSQTLRNFVLYATPGFDAKLGDFSFDEVCRIVHHQMGLEITPKNMAAMMATNVNDEKPLFLRATPLFIKNVVMKAVFVAVGERKTCFNFSNLGVVQVPEEFSRYVMRMDFVLSPQASAPYNTSALTYGGKIYLNVIRNISDAPLEQEIYRVFRELGLHVRAESNAR